MRRHVWQRTLSHTSHDLNKSRPVPPIVKEARERIEQVQRISQPQQSTGLRLPPFPLDEQASDSAHVPEPSSILPSFRRQQLGTLTAALLAQTDYPSDTSESTSRTSRAVLDEAWLQRLPQHIESASNAVWLKAATGHDQRPIKHATPQLLRRCRKSNNKELTRTVLERKLSLDGLESIHATSWHTLAHHGWTIWVQATFLSVWLRRLLSLSESHFNEERKQWLLLWRCIHADLTKHRIPVDPALQDALLRWSELPPDGAKKNVLILQSLIQQYCKPLPAWSPSMCISLLAWLEHHRKCAPTDKQSRLADDIAHLADTIRSIFPPPLHVSLPQAAPTSSSDKALQRAYQSGHLAQGRGLLVTLLQANQFNATLPPSTWRLLRIHDPSLFVWTALRYLISLDDLTSAEKKAWLGLYLASRGPGQPGVAAETQAGLLTDETVKLWAKDRKSQADVQQAVSAWTDQVIGPGLCADFNGLFAKHFLHLCKHRQDLREEIATFLYRIAQLPIVSLHCRALGCPPP